MKNQVTIAAILIITLFLMIAASGMAQDEKEKKVTIKTVKVEDGRKVVKDTTFTVGEGEDVKDLIKDVEWIVEEDSLKMTLDVFVDEESTDHCIRKVIIRKGDGDEEVVEEIILPPGHKGKKKVMKIKTDDGEEVVMVMPRKHSKAMVWHSDDDYDFEFDVDHDFEFDTKEFEEELEVHIRELEDANVFLLDAEIELLDELEDLEEMEIKMIRRPRPPKHPNLSRHHIERFEHGVSDKELRDAGIKNKPDRLEVDQLDIDNNDGVVTLNFTIPGDVSPKVEVYNFFGDKVFSGKPKSVKMVNPMLISHSTRLLCVMCSLKDALIIPTYSSTACLLGTPK